MDTCRYLFPLVLCGMIVALGFSTSHAQDDVELRAILRLLEKRLGDAPAANDAGPRTDRVTEIGASRRQVVVEQIEEKEVVRIYDLSDLFAIAPPYAAMQASDLRPASISLLTGQSAMFPGQGNVNLSSGGGMGGGLSGIGGGVFNLPSPAADGKAVPKQVLPQFGGIGLSHGADAEGNFGGSRISFDDLIDAIETTIEPTEWEPVGGPGTIQPLGNALIVRATPSIHEQVDNLLGLLRQKWGTLRTISVEGWWLWMNEEDANTLLTDDRPKGDNAKVFGTVDNDAFAKRVSDIAANENARPGYRAKITCYNGQTVNTVSGGQQLYVTDLIPVADGESIGYRPVVSLVQEGAALQVRPHATQKGNFAALDIHTRVNLLARSQPPATKPAAEVLVEEEAKAKDKNVNTALAAAAAIDRPRLQNARLSTSLRLPIDQVMLVGAMSFDADPAHGSENLYLFVKLAMQELRDDLPEEQAGEELK